MCGRSRCSLSPRQVVAAAGVPDDRWKNQENYQPSHNVAPGYNTPVVKRDKQHELEVHTMKWGLVPSFTKSTTEKPDHFRMFNARSETVAEKTVFSRLLQKQRCVVLFNGFYEWKKEGPRKQPYYVNTGEGQVMRMAGLFDVWFAEDGPLYTYTILTTDSSKRLEWLHNRMPVLLTSDEQVEAWLDVKPLTDKIFNNICAPYNGEDLVWHAVTTSMSSMGYQSPDASKELKKGNIASFFKTNGSAKSAKPVTGGAAAAKPVTKPVTEGAAAADKSLDVHTTPKAAAFASKSPASIKSEGNPSQQAQLTSDIVPTAADATTTDTSSAHANLAATLPAQHSRGQSLHVKAEHDLVDGQAQGSAQKKDGDILNTDDAGGIVAKSEPDPAEAANDAQDKSPAAKHHLSPGGPPEKHASATKKAKRSHPEKGTIDSFFGRKP